MNKSQHEFVGHQSLQDVMEELLIVLIKSGLIFIDDNSNNE